MALTVSNVLTRAQDVIQDTTNVRWPQAELLRWLNDCRRDIAIVRPDLYATTQTVTLVTGTKQTLPAAGTRFLDAVRNVDAVTNDPEGAVRIVEREVLDAQRPDWHTETPTSALKHFMFDERNPRVFYVYPPAVSGHKLDIVYSVTPTEITDVNTELTNEDIYTGAIVDYLCYRAFSKDAEYAGNAGRAASHYQAFATALGIGNRVNMVTSPNTANVGGMMPRTGQAELAAR
jgi:hypothetical protein